MSTIFVNDNNPLGARGMARYFRHAVDGIIDRYGADVTVFSSAERDYAPARFIRAQRFKGSEQFSLHDRLAARYIWREQPDAVFSAWFNTLRPRAPHAIVMYDLIFELYPHYHARRQTPLRDLYRERHDSLRRADAIIAISHCTASDIRRVYPDVTPSKIVVIPLGVDASFFATQLDEPPASRPYFLFVGFRNGHKNFMRLLEAFGQSGCGRDFDLRVVSAAPFNDAESHLIEKHQLRDRIIHHAGVNDAALRCLYAHAHAFVYPSEYEGFGLPILEAMASGTLVLTSKTSSMPEVGGDAALYFDPLDATSMANGLRHAAGLPDAERLARITAGRQRATTFTWQRCQALTVALIGDLLSRRCADVRV